MKWKNVKISLLAAVLLLANTIPVAAEEPIGILPEASSENIVSETEDVLAFLKEDQALMKQNQNNIRNSALDWLCEKKEQLGSVNHLEELDTSLPGKVDLSQNIYFPEIKSQGSKGSCVAFANVYYMYTYEVNRMKNISSKSLENCYSPAYVYNETVSKSSLGKYGLFISEVLNFLQNRGCVKWTEMPYNEQESSSYETCQNVDAMINALSMRVESWMRLKLDFENANPVKEDNTENELYKVKLLLNSGKVLTMGVHGMQYKKTSSGEEIIARLTNGPTGHAIAIVGYDDTIWCDLNGNGVKEKAEMGALKLADSYGNSYMNNGFIWLSYDALNKKSKLSDGSWETGFANNMGRVALDEVYAINVSHKDLNVIAKFDVNMESRRDFKIGVGGGPEMGHGGYDGSYNGTIVYDYGTPLSDEALVGTKSWAAFIKTENEKKCYSGQVTLVDNQNNIIKNSEKYTNFTGKKQYSVTTNLIYGDMDYDGRISQKDAQKVMNIALKSLTPSNVQGLLADYDRNGKVDLKDAQAVLKKSLKIE